MQVVVFSLGGERYALPIERIQEILRHQTPKPVGSPIPCVAGVIELRGRIVPVCDVTARVAARPARSERQKIVVVDLPGGLAGVLVDAVDQVVALPPEQLAPVPPEVASDLIRAIGQVGGELVIVLDAERLLDGVVESAAEPEPEAPPRKRAAPRKPAAGKSAPRKRAARKPAAAKPAQPSRKRPEKATRSTGAAATGSPSSVTA